MGKNHLISVVIPVYKVEEFLDRCVQSVVDQTYKNLEIILIDDGSPDNCPKMCDEWAKKDKRIKVIHKPNGGVSSARNLGIEKATGDYIAFVDSDDWIDLEMYEEVLKKATETKADMVFCKIRNVYSNGKISNIEELTIDDLKEKRIINFFAFGNNTSIFGSACRCLIKSNIAKNCRFTSKLKHGEDLFYVLDCIEKSEKIEVVDKYFYNYYVNTASVTKNISEVYFKNIKELYDYQKKYIKSKGLDCKHLIDHGYLFRNVTKRMNRRDFVKEIKALENNDGDFKKCFNKENYKKIQRIEIGIKNKIRNFVVYHKMWRVVKFLNKIR